LKHGSITTDELSQLYGYDHPPRAARDVKEHGIPLLMTRVTASSGRRIARYSLDVEGFFNQRAGKRGRRAIPRPIKAALVRNFGIRCESCQAEYEEDRFLQVDHRVPFEIAGDPSFDDWREFMLLCPSCNREKSWTCEHCPNWTAQNEDVCQTCYWAHPGEYSHVATVPLRIVRLAFEGRDIKTIYAELVSEATDQSISIQQAIKQRLRRRGQA
jgi:hypothetical protein